MKKKEFCVGPMSKTIVDAIIDIAKFNKNINFWFIPSRRQIDYNSGYVNNWTTGSFAQYVYDESDRESRPAYINIQRDHGGPGQGELDDDGFESLRYDSIHFDSIHIDPWKVASSFQEGAELTVNLIKKSYSIAADFFDSIPLITYEIGTEEAIKKLTNKQIEQLIKYCKENLDEDQFRCIRSVVIQAGTKLSGTQQVGVFDPSRFEEGVTIAKMNNLLSKEHNGDYLTPTQIASRFSMGLDAINIAPMFGVWETSIYLDALPPEGKEELYTLAYQSGKWKKWVSSKFDPIKNKIELIRICGHYLFSTMGFQQIKEKYIPTLNPLSELQKFMLAYFI